MIQTEKIPARLIHDILEKYAGGAAYFKPGKDFYSKIGVGQKRWGQLKRGEASPTIAELRAICQHFYIAFEPETFFRQLLLFPELELQNKKAVNNEINLSH